MSENAAGYDSGFATGSFMVASADGDLSFCDDLETAIGVARENTIHDGVKRYVCRVLGVVQVTARPVEVVMCPGFMRD